MTEIIVAVPIAKLQKLQKKERKNHIDEQNKKSPRTEKWRQNNGLKEDTMGQGSGQQASRRQTAKI